MNSMGARKFQALLLAVLGSKADKKAGRKKSVRWTLSIMTAGKTASHSYHSVLYGSRRVPAGVSGPSAHLKNEGALGGDMFPRKTMEDFAAGRIDRPRFVRSFGAWQRAAGIDYQCKGICEGGGEFLVYRGTRGLLWNGIIEFTDADNRRRMAGSLFQFKRLVDFMARRVKE